MTRKETKSRWMWGIFSCILTVIFLFPLKGMKVDAAEKERKCSISIPISVEVKSETGNVEPETFKYGLEAVDENAEEVKFSSITVNKAGVTTGRFAEMSYTRPGDYKYKVYQQRGENKDMLYDSSIYEVTVRVLNTPDGGLNAEVWAVKDESEQKVDEIKFVNIYKETTQTTTETTPNTTHYTTTNTVTRSSIGTSSPKTGDSSNLFLWSAVAVVTALCILLFVLVGKRREE